jgi:hypothetical protein
MKVDQDQGSDVALIVNLVSKLAQAADHGNLVDYLALMTPDIVWEVHQVPSIGLPAQMRRGHPQVLAGAQERRDAGIQGPGTDTLHVISNVLVVPGAIEARATAYVHFYGNVSTLPELRAISTYRDRFVRYDDRWLLAHRQILQGGVAFSREG